MKRKILSSMALVAGLSTCVTSCSSDGLSAMWQGEDNGGIAIVADSFRNCIMEPSCEVPAVTRTTLEKGKTGLDFKWSKGDIVGLFEQTGTQQTLMKMVSGEGTGTARFSAETYQLNPRQRLKAIHPTRITTDAVIPVSWEGQAQAGNNDWTHLSKYDYMVSDITTPTDSNRADFRLHHVGAIVRVRAYMPVATTCTAMTLSAVDSAFTVSAGLDLFGDSLVVPSKKSDRVSVSLDNASVNAYGTVTAWIMVAPVDLSSRSVTITVTSADGTDYSCVIPKGVNMEAGGIYSIDEGWVEYKEDSGSNWTVMYPDGDNTYNIDGDGLYGFRVVREQKNVNVKLTRTFKEMIWTGWVAPFDMEVTSDLLNEYDFGYLEGVSNGGEEIDKDNLGTAIIGTKLLKAGDVVKANLPYIVRAKSAGQKTFELSNTTLKVTNPVPTKITGNDYYYTSTGIYTTKVASQQDNGWYSLTHSTGAFSLRSGRTPIKLELFNFYLTVTGRDDNPYKSPSSIAIGKYGDGSVQYKADADSEWTDMSPDGDNTYYIDGDALYAFRVTGARENVNVKFTRTFTKDIRTGWVAPFDMVATSDLLGNYEFSYLEGVSNGGEDIDKDNMRSAIFGTKLLKEGDTIYANKPYVVLPKVSGKGTFEVKNTALEVTNPIETRITGNAYYYTSTGIYATKVASQQDNGWYALAHSTGIFSLCSGNTAIELEPFNFYLTVTDRTDNPYNTN